MNPSILTTDPAYRDEPLILVFSDYDAGDTCRSIETVRGRAIAVDIDDAVERLDSQANVSGVVIDLSDDPGPSLDALLARVNDGPVEIAVLVIVPVALTDRVWSAVTRSDVVILLAPDPFDRQLEAGMLVDAARRRALPFVGEPSARLRQLSEEMVRVAALLGSLSADVATLRASLPPREAAITPDPGTIRSIIRARRLRDRYFGDNLFADPAWDMLLDLAAARIEGRRVAVSSLCIAAAVPPTTALRWIRTLTDGSVFERQADAEDGRRVFIAISRSAADAMSAYLIAAGSGALAG